MDRSGRCLMMLFLALSTGSSAQELQIHGVTHKEIPDSSNFIDQLPIHNRQYVAAKKAAAKPRLIQVFWGLGDSTLPMGVIPFDSISYTYSGGRGGDLTSDPLPFDSSNFLIWNRAVSAYVDNAVTTNHFNAQSLIDTTVTYRWNSGFLVPANRYTYTYNLGLQTTRLITETFAAGAWELSGQTTYLYNAQGKVDTVTDEWEVLANGQWNRSFRWVFSYNAVGNPLALTGYYKYGWPAVFIAANRYVVTYNINGDTASWSREKWINPTQQATGHYETEWRHRYYYASGGKSPIIDVLDSSATGSLQPQDSNVIYTYVVGGQTTIIDSHFRWDGSLWQLWSRTSTDLTGAGNASVSLKELRTGIAWINSKRFFYFYNGYDQLTREYSESWMQSGWNRGNGDFENRYYYEQYASNAVKPEARHLPLLILQPNPASSSVTLSIPLDASTVIKASVVDVLGRTMYEWSDMPERGLYVKNIDVAEWPAGRFFLSVIDGTSKVCGNFTVQH